MGHQPQSKHAFIFAFDDVIHGIHIATGRQTGSFADPKPLVALPEADANELDSATRRFDEQMQPALATLLAQNSVREIGSYTDRLSIIRALETKQWYHHWETHDRNQPFRWLAEATGSAKRGAARINAIKRVVCGCSDSSHLLFLIDDSTWRGFWIGVAENTAGSGRQVGMFSNDPPPAGTK